MRNTFYADRPYIENEYELAEWDESSGIPPAEINRKVREFAASAADMHPALIVANCYRIMLEEAQISLNGRTPFPDKIRHGAVYKRDASASVLEMYFRERYDKALYRYCPQAWAHRKFLALSGISIPDVDVWHTVLDWERTLRLGPRGMLDALYASMHRMENEGKLDEERKVFFDAEIMAFEALITYIKRLRAAAEKMGLDEYAEALEHILTAPPATLYQVLCLSHIMLNVVEIGRERCRSLGAVDELYLPYYISDLEKGILTPESAKEMFRYFWQKIAAEKRYADQPICLGKTWKDDSSPAAELILIMLEAYEELNIHNPKIHVRCAENMSDVLLTKVADMIRKGNSSIVLVNDETVLKGYEKIGIPRETADKYIPIGCYESAIPGLEDARICAAWINLAKPCEYAISGGRDMLGGLYVGQHTNEPQSWEEFLECYFSYLHEHCQMVMDNINEQAPFAYLANPSPYYSGSIESCVERGRDVFDRGMEYRNQSVKCFAIATAVDSLLAVKKYVFGEKAVTLGELREILKNDWQGAEALRTRIMNDKTKYGNNIEEADSLAVMIFDFCAKEIIGKPTSTGGVFRMGCDSVNMAEDYGGYTAASADGRAARAPLSKNMRPVNGMEKSVTSFISSVCKIDNSIFVNGAPLDFAIHPSAVEGEAGLAALKNLIRVFLLNGGFAIQGNVLDLNTLLDAREHPEKYPTLQVRVCGWNEYFVNMSKTVQDDFIKRITGLEK